MIFQRVQDILHASLVIDLIIFLMYFHCMGKVHFPQDADWSKICFRGRRVPLFGVVNSFSTDHVLCPFCAANK